MFSMKKLIKLIEHTEKTKSNSFLEVRVPNFLIRNVLQELRNKGYVFKYNTLTEILAITLKEKKKNWVVFFEWYGLDGKEHYENIKVEAKSKLEAAIITSEWSKQLGITKYITGIWDNPDHAE